MEQKILILLGLNLYSELQLYHIIVLVGITEVSWMFVILRKRKYLVKKIDFIMQYVAMYQTTYVWWYIEHLTFFSCIFYNTVYLFMIYWIYWYLKYKCKAKWAKKC